MSENTKTWEFPSGFNPKLFTSVSVYHEILIQRLAANRRGTGKNFSLSTR